jgi:hypothetical protein
MHCMHSCQAQPGSGKARSTSYSAACSAYMRLAITRTGTSPKGHHHDPAYGHATCCSQKQSSCEGQHADYGVCSASSRCVPGARPVPHSAAPTKHREPAQNNLKSMPCCSWLLMLMPRHVVARCNQQSTRCSLHQGAKAASTCAQC